MSSPLSLFLLLLVTLGGCHRVFPFKAPERDVAAGRRDIGVADLLEDQSAVLPEDRPGYLDPRFGVGGTAIIDFDGGDQAGSHLLIQPGGKLLIAGWTGNQTTGRDFLLTRLDAEGKLDENFGEGGLTVTNTGGTQDRAQKLIAVSSEGRSRFIAAGNSGSVDDEMIAVVAYDEYGHRDTTFGEESTGIVTIDFENGQDIFGGLLPHGDHGLLVVGTHGNQTAALAWLTASGELDPGHGDGGKLLTGEVYWIGDATLQTDDRILTTNWGSGCTIHQYSEDGSPDPDFGADGIATARLNPEDHCARLKLTDEHILVGGQRGTEGRPEDLVIVRFDHAGRLDTSFAENGAKPLSGALETEDVINEDIGRIEVQADGKILILGSYAYKGTWHIWLTRLDQNGHVDTGFGDDLHRWSIDTRVDAHDTSRFIHLGVTLSGDGHAFIVGSIFNGKDSDLFVAKIQLGPGAS